MQNVGQETSRRGARFCCCGLAGAVLEVPNDAQHEADEATLLVRTASEPEKQAVVACCDGSGCELQVGCYAVAAAGRIWRQILQYLVVAFGRVWPGFRCWCVWCVGQQLVAGAVVLDRRSTRCCDE
jgi:hypothetical protein